MSDYLEAKVDKIQLLGDLAISFFANTRERRRYETARHIMAGLAANSYHASPTERDAAVCAVAWADYMLEELDKTTDQRRLEREAIDRASGSH